MSNIDPTNLTREARELIAHAERQGRDLSDFEAGRVDALLEVAERLEPTNHPQRPEKPK